VRLLPLTLTVHPSGWLRDGWDEGEDPARILNRDRHTCQFCGLTCPSFQSVYHLDGDHARSDPDNLAAACPLCHACQHLGRETINQEFTLIWLPELSQAALNHVVRAVHLIFHAHGEPAHMAERPRADTPALRSAYRTYRALADRAGSARQRIGTTSPRDLGAALLGLPRSLPPRPSDLLDGMRLHGRGRMFRDGTDIYPDVLAAWAAPAPSE
jgi:intracellular multiplication protein IcmJ